MQEIKSTVINELNYENVDQIKEMYQDFRAKSAVDYKFEIPPLEFDQFKEVVKEGLISNRTARLRISNV